ncbi:MAG: LytR C-terminal domain-containing protein [Thermoleophilaceae bacterium]
MPPATAQPGTAAASPAAAGGGTATATPPRTGPPPVTPSPRTLPSTGGQTAILSPPSRAMDEGPWYRRITWPEPRYIALIVAGVLVLGAGAAYGITQLTSSSSSPSSSDQGQAAPGASGSSQGSKSSKPAPVDPSKVTVAVLNGTRIPGLAAHVGDRVQSNGFQLGNVATATEAQRAESVVEFKSGSNRAARLVARKLHITQIEPLDPSSGDQGLTGNAQVLVIVGADQQRGSSSTGTGSTGGGSTGTGTGTGGAGTGTGSPGTGTPGAGGTATSP